MNRSSRWVGLDNGSATRAHSAVARQTRSGRPKDMFCDPRRFLVRGRTVRATSLPVRRKKTGGRLLPDREIVPCCRRIGGGPVHGSLRLFGVREDTIGLGRSCFGKGGVEALKVSVAPEPPPLKCAAALRIVTPLPEKPIADRLNWTNARLRAEIETRVGVRNSRSPLFKALRKGVPLPAALAHAERAADRQRGRAGRPASAMAQASGRSEEHHAALWRSECRVDSSIPRQSLGRDRQRRSRCWPRSIAARDNSSPTPARARSSAISWRIWSNSNNSSRHASPRS